MHRELSHCTGLFTITGEYRVPQFGLRGDVPDKLCAAIVAGHWTFPKQLHLSDVGPEVLLR